MENLNDSIFNLLLLNCLGYNKFGCLNNVVCYIYSGIQRKATNSRFQCPQIKIKKMSDYRQKVYITTTQKLF